MARGASVRWRRGPGFTGVLAGLLLLTGTIVFSAPAPATNLTLHWWKGNLHTHTLWSDGDDYPEMVADWYKKQGYHFLALSDHNTMLEGSRWISVARSRGGFPALQRYVERFGNLWVEQRFLGGTQQVRLKTLAEFRIPLEQRDRFLLIPAEEITDRHRLLPLHLNATNLRQGLKPAGGTNVTDVLQRNVNAVLEQRTRTRQPMLPHVNHPNFEWAITAEDLMPVRGLRFFEVYNGHPFVNNEGDEHHPHLDRLWDILLAFRLGNLRLEPLFGLAVDDSHHYHAHAPTNSNSGRGWIMVRAAHLSAPQLIDAMERGDFYASSGVRLREVRRETNALSLEIEAEPGVRYVTRFIGTRRGFDSTSQPGTRPAESIYPVTRRYSADIGQILADVPGTNASYTFDGDELYVRATVISSKLKTNAVVAGEFESAWVQPVVGRAP